MIAPFFSLNRVLSFSDITYKISAVPTTKWESSRMSSWYLPPSHLYKASLTISISWEGYSSTGNNKWHTTCSHQ